MSEQITLPKSGIALEREGNARDTDIFSHGGGFVRFNVRSRRADFNYRSRITGSTRDEAIAWLDARVLELRAALLPADARERVAAALVPQVDHIGNFDYEEAIDAVLAALGGES